MDTGPGWPRCDHPVDTRLIDHLIGGAGAPYRFQVLIGKPMSDTNFGLAKKGEVTLGMLRCHQSHAIVIIVDTCNL